MRVDFELGGAVIARRECDARTVEYSDGGPPLRVPACDWIYVRTLCGTLEMCIDARNAPQALQLADALRAAALRHGAQESSS